MQWVSLLTNTLTPITALVAKINTTNNTIVFFHFFNTGVIFILKTAFSCCAIFTMITLESNVLMMRRYDPSRN